MPSTGFAIRLTRLRGGLVSFLRSLPQNGVFRLFNGILIIAAVVCSITGLVGPACSPAVSSDSAVPPKVSTPSPAVPGPTAQAAPVISNLKVLNIMPHSCTISWQTDVPSTAELVYIAAGSNDKKVWYGNQLMTQHRAILEALVPATEYSFVVKVTAPANGRTSMETGSFTTEPLIRKTGTAVGDLAPDFTLEDISGRSVSLGHYRGKWVMLVFWDIYCSSCRAQMSQLQIYMTDKPESLEVFSVNIGEVTQDQLMSMLKSRGITYPVLMDRSADVAVEYRVSVYPTTYLIDPQGVIRGFREERFDTRRQIAEFVDSVLNK